MANDSLTRWEKTRRDALGTAIALLFGLASGGAAYCSSLLTNKEAEFGGTGTWFYLATALMFILCLIASIAVTVTRLCSFRATVEVVRKREAGNDANALEGLRRRSNRFDSWTWGLFWLQLATFTLGAALLVCTLGILFHQRLFP